MQCDLDKKKPIVSVIIPTYNRQDTLQRAIQSVLNQTYQKFEIIVADDASMISPEKIVRDFKDERIKFVRHNSNKGGAAARNTAIKESIGEYVAFLDSDDEWFPKHLSCQMKSFENCPLKVGAHYSGLLICSHEGKIVGRRIPFVSGNICSEIFIENCIGPLSSVIVRRSALNQCGLFDERLPSCQDWDIFIRIAQKFHFEYIKKITVRYYLGEKSITSNAMAKASGHKMIIVKYTDNIKKNKKSYCNQLITIGHYFCKSGNTNQGRKEFFDAIAANPLSFRAYLFWICSLFGAKFYNFLISIHNRKNISRNNVKDSTKA